MTHRLFPGFTALWFAALFGLGSLAASADALAALVLHLHLPAILPAAAPPLGLTARLLAALALAGLGGVFGLVLGLVLYARAGGALPVRLPRVAAVAEPGPAEPRSAEPKSDPVASHAQAPRVRSRDAHPDAPPRRPLVVSDDVLPYPATVFEPAFVQPETTAQVMTAQAIAPSAHEDFAVEYSPFAPDLSTAEPEDLAQEDLAQHDLPPFLAAALSAAQRAEGPVFVVPSEPIILPAEPEAIEPEPVVVAVPAPPVSLPPLASLAAATPQAPLSEAPLASLGLVQLIERLALAIATRQARRAAAPAPVPTVDAVDPRMPLHRFDPLTMDPTGPLLRAKPARFDQVDLPEVEAYAEHSPAEHAPPEHAPVAGHGALLHDPLAAAGAWADEDHADHLGPRFLGAPAGGDHPDDAHALTAGFVADHDASTDDGIIEHRYSSLVDMAMPRPELVSPELVPLAAPVSHVPGHFEASEAGPVVPFPLRLSGGEASAASAPHDFVPNEADRALREALATLRRMSAQR
jgi:hypothetical protein